MRPFRPHLPHQSLEWASLSAANAVQQLPAGANNNAVEIQTTDAVQIRFGSDATVDATTGQRGNCLAYLQPIVLVLTIPDGATHVSVTGSGMCRMHFGGGL